MLVQETCTTGTLRIVSIVVRTTDSSAEGLALTATVPPAIFGYDPSSYAVNVQPLTERPGCNKASKKAIVETLIIVPLFHRLSGASSKKARTSLPCPRSLRTNPAPDEARLYIRRDTAL